MSVRENREAHKVLLIPTGSLREPVNEDAVRMAGGTCIRLDGHQALSLLLSNPFGVTAIVLAGDGESRAAHSTLRTLKSTAPRIPIIFLDENPTTSSELRIRRTGVHFYSHTPVDTGEIIAVLSVLTDSFHSSGSSQRAAALAG